ncbi:hypothetical protein BC936DRAFT_139417 [Jimgerdemannia flammicorona]|uniref:Uncharacterized protein n=1 Tax=Jimgerdemannia flammicorona TaxID=994334 RepID=A0A433B9X4_9FUNG|nr:hypothetical protein BC936DRAFT_139417 [Jimgerdemannia flammicorona]
MTQIMDTVRLAIVCPLTGSDMCISAQLLQRTSSITQWHIVHLTIQWESSEVEITIANGATDKC